jgi:hypothetical protein
MKKEKLFYLHLLVELESFRSFSEMSQKRINKVMGEGLNDLKIQKLNAAKQVNDIKSHQVFHAHLLSY